MKDFWYIYDKQAKKYLGHRPVKWRAMKIVDWLNDRYKMIKFAVIPGPIDNYPRTDKDKIDFIVYWFDWFMEHTSTFDTDLELALSYLWPAVAKSSHIEEPIDSEIIKLLKEFKIPDENPIWKFIQVLKED